MKSGQTKIKMLAMVLTSSVLLSACGQNEQPKPVVKPVKQFTQTTVVQGLVIVKGHPVSTGLVMATDESGKLLAEMSLQAGNHYRLEIPAQTKTPVILRYTPEADSPAADQLIAVVVEPSVTQYDISALSTAIAGKAQALGGYTRSNMVLAAESMVNVPDANKTSAGFRGDPTKQYGGWH